MCKYGEICSPLFRCHFCRLDARLELRIKEAIVEQQTRRIGFFTFPEPVLVERTVVVEDSSPGLSFLGATLGGLLGSALSNRRKEVIERRQKALPSKRKHK